MRSFPAVLGRLFKPVGAACCLIFICTYTASACVDSIQVKKVQIQCHGMRNGVIEVKSAYGGAAPYHYSLDGLSFSTNPTFDRLKAGEYMVYVRDASGCTKSWPINLPEPEILQVKLVITDTVVNAGDLITVKAQLTPETVPLNQLDWRPDDLFEHDASLTQYIRLAQNTDLVVEVSNKDRCVSRDVRTITVDETHVYIPNVFNPKSDQDAWFTVFSGNGLNNILRLQVYGRNGEEIFSRTNLKPNDPLSGWNGRYNGKYVQSGVYLWVAELQYFDGRTQKRNGTVTVVY